MVVLHCTLGLGLVLRYFRVRTSIASMAPSIPSSVIVPKESLPLTNQARFNSPIRHHPLRNNFPLSMKYLLNPSSDPPLDGIPSTD